MTTLDEYEEVIRTRVCTECLEPSGYGVCGTGRREDCALNQFLPAIVKTVNSVKSGSLEDYIDAVRSAIAKQCEELPSEIRRDYADLPHALDSFFPMIVEAIQEVNARRRKGTNLI